MLRLTVGLVALVGDACRAVPATAAGMVPRECLSDARQTQHGHLRCPSPPDGEKGLTGALATERAGDLGLEFAFSGSYFHGWEAGAVAASLNWSKPGQTSRTRYAPRQVGLGPSPCPALTSS